MRLCKRNDRNECDNEKLNNSAYCFSCHKEIHETNKYVSSFSGPMGGMMAQLHEARGVISRENSEMMRVLKESMDRISEIRKMQKQYADASPRFRLRPYQEAAVSVTNTCNLSSWPNVTVYGGS